jgi:hypothetical protein
MLCRKYKIITNWGVEFLAAIFNICSTPGARWCGDKLRGGREGRRGMINRASMTWLESPWDSDLTNKSGAFWVPRQNRQVAPHSVIKHIDRCVIYNAQHRVPNGLMDWCGGRSVVYWKQNLGLHIFHLHVQDEALNTSKWKLLPRHCKCLICCCHKRSMMDESSPAFCDD